MTLPGSGPLSISQIAAEFGVALPCVFPDAFYGKAGLPGSGALSMSSFHGLSNATFNPDGGFISEIEDGSAFTQLLCNIPAVWTFTGGGSGGSVNISSGDSSTSCSFLVNASGHIGRHCIWNVHAVAGGVSRDFTVDLTANGT